MQKQDFDNLLTRFANETLPPEEQQQLEQWFVELRQHDDEVIWTAEEIDLLYQNIVERRGAAQPTIQKPSMYRLWLKIAAITTLLGFAGYFMYKQFSKKTVEYIQADQIFPSQDAPVLVLENGEKIILQQDQDGIVVSGDEIRYMGGSGEVSSKLGNGSNAKLTLQTPKGVNYAVTLSDGTKVWLNAQSSLTYSRAFASDRREVEVNGEAYFEVARETVIQDGKSINKPFIVTSGRQQIEVLGTKFNVTDYNTDHKAVTSLFHGAVALRNERGRSVFLKPSDQASLIDGSDQFDVQKNADIESSIGWKDNLFVFHNASLKTILSEVERWYDVEVDIEAWPAGKFYGEVNRNAPLSEVLKVIELSSQIRFKIVADGEERRLLMQ